MEESLLMGNDESDYSADILAVLQSIDGRLEDIQIYCLDAQNKEETDFVEPAQELPVPIDYTEKLGVMQSSLEHIESALAVPEQSAVDYTNKFDSLIQCFVIIIFLIGITCGLISAKLMWGRVRI